MTCDAVAAEAPQVHGADAVPRGVRGCEHALVQGRGRLLWRGLSSTSPGMDVTKAFLAKGTLFVIEGGWGCNIQPYSLFPDEEEILLELEWEFRVESVIDAKLTVIKLEMLDTPLLLPEVFGPGVN